MPSFILHYCLLTQLADAWLQQNDTRFPFLSFVSNIDAAMTNKISILVTIVGVLYCKKYSDFPYLIKLMFLFPVWTI